MVNQKFIEWNELFKIENSYVKNDSIRFDIEIEAEPPNQINRSKFKFEQLTETLFRLIVSNADNLIAVQSPKFILFDLPWNVVVYKDHSSYLGVRTMRMQSRNETSCKIKMGIKLFSNAADVKPIEQTQTKDICAFDCIETQQFLSWDELFHPENGFVENKSITLHVEILCNVD